MRANLIAVAVTFLTIPYSLPGANPYVQHNLVSDFPGLADQLDPKLVNPWGIAFSATGPFWIADNHTSVSTVYNTGGTASSGVVAIPIHPTGIVQNSTTDFAVAPGFPASFIFCSQSGTISAWNASVNASSAVVKVDRSSTGASYTGLARANNATGSALYAVNFSAGTVEVYDANFNPISSVSSFQDPMIPAGFSPFNIWNSGNRLYVTYAPRDTLLEKRTLANGGYVDVFDVNGLLIQRVAAGSPLNSPWGLAIAPPKFGGFSGALLVGNFLDGTIDAFNPSTGVFLGMVSDLSGKTVTIPGLWSLAAGNGASAGDSNAIYFTAGITGGAALQSHGLFGSLQAPPVVNPNGIVNAASFQLGSAPYTYISILGNNLATTTRTWQSYDFVNGNLPQTLDGVSVTVNGFPAYISYISPTQINALLPLSDGPGELTTFNNGLSSTPVGSQYFPLSPAFFQFGSSGYVAATHADGTLIGPPGMFSASTSPARVGEIVTLYGNGFGATNPKVFDGKLITAALPLATLPSLSFAGVPAQVLFGGITAPGLYQFNVAVPAGVSGIVPVIAQVGSTFSPPVMLFVQ